MNKSVWLAYLFVFIIDTICYGCAHPVPQKELCYLDSQGLTVCRKEAAPKKNKIYKVNDTYDNVPIWPDQHP